MTYAAQTTVSAEKSRAEIERTLMRYGADQFFYGWEEGRAAVRFRANGKHVVFMLPIPDRKAREFVYGPRNVWSERPKAAQEAAYEKAIRQRWRALLLVIKAKLEAVESGITSFEDEFLAHFLLPDGSTVGDWAKPQLEQAYAEGLMPTRLLGLPDPKS